MTKWEWYQNNNVKAVFLHCLLMANWEDKRWQGKIIHRGEFVTSLSHMANDLGMTPRKVDLALAKLEQTGEIERNASNRFTLIKCCNYSLYQDKDNEVCETDVKQMSNGCKTDVKQMSTTNNNNKKNNKNNYNKKQRLKCEIGFDINEIKRKAMLNDDYDI